jgi:uncharacterized protein YqjF (DUF2071 family)
MAERPLLTARWRNLLLLNFAVPGDVVKRLAPRGTEPDQHDGLCYASMVGFQFQNVRLFGVPFPGHTNFPEINLRYYVRRNIGDEIRRGVVFAREIAPRRAVAIAAKLLYNENYITRPMRSDIRIAGSELSPGDSVEYAWKCGCAKWSRLAGRVAGPLALPPAGSPDEFFVEHYWGYARGRDGQTREYRVAHNPWRTAVLDNVTWECDIASTYETPLAEYLEAPPVSALVADGSTIRLFRGRKVVG